MSASEHPPERQRTDAAASALRGRFPVVSYNLQSEARRQYSALDSLQRTAAFARLADEAEALLAAVGPDVTCDALAAGTASRREADVVS
jgi:hypothetical protein